MNSNKKYPSDFWIGLAQVETKDATALDGVNAYVNVVSIAKNRNDFRQKIKQALREMNMQLKRLEDAEQLSRRVEKFEVNEKLLKLADSLFENAEQVKFSTFHVYD